MRFTSCLISEIVFLIGLHGLVSNVQFEQGRCDSKECDSQVFGPWEIDSNESLLQRVVVMGFKMEAIFTECLDRDMGEEYKKSVRLGKDYFESQRWRLVADHITTEDGEIVVQPIDYKQRVKDDIQPVSD